MIKKVLVLLACLCILVHGVAYGETSTSELQAFVGQVYQEYAGQAFDAVYAAMYPSIQESVSEEDYLEFQRHHFERLRLELKEIEVGEVNENPELPRTLRQLLPPNQVLHVYGVEISYRAHFVRGVKLNQGVSKTVYVAVGHPSSTQKSLYLLWDPSSMEDGETDQ